MSNALIVTAEPGTPFIDTEREFDAPVDAVFRAYADPDLYKQWIGGGFSEPELERYEFRTGGSYRYISRDSSGAEYAFRGVFHVVRKNELAVQTWEFEGYPDTVSLEYMTFVDLGEGRCKIVGHSVMPSVEARDGLVASGMESGMSAGYDLLERVAAELVSSR